MDDRPRQVLNDLIRRFGESLADDPIRTEGLLRDTCGAHPREIFVLVSAIRQRVPADLLAPRTAIPPDMLREFLAQRLRDEISLSGEASVWAVESWAEALGLAGSAGYAGEAAGRPGDSRGPESPRPADPAAGSGTGRLAGELESFSLATRLQAVRELAPQRDPASLRLLISSLSNGNWQVRAEAFDALSAAGTEAVPFLVEALRGENDQVTWRSCLVLGGLKAREAADSLTGLLDRDGIIRECAIWALGEIGDKSASTALLRYLHDADPVVRQEAENALVKIGKKDSGHST